MVGPEDNLIEMSTNTQDENLNNTSDNNKYNSSLVQGAWGERGKTRKDTRSNTSNTATSSTTNKGYKEEITGFGSVLAFRYEKLEFCKSFGVFR